jgi:DNA-binding NtrC family response regulator
MGSDPLHAGRGHVVIPPVSGTQDVGSAVLILDDEPGMRSFLKRGLSRRFALVETASSTAEAEALLRRCHFDLLIADIRLPGKSGVAWVQELRDQGSSLDVIFITAHADLETAVAALRAGASDFILKPFRIDQLLTAVGRNAERRITSGNGHSFRGGEEQYLACNGMLGDSEPMQDVRHLIERVASLPSTVLIQGESGTGKELAARAIHARSRRPGSFVAINCGAVSPELLESELFGHIKGAFTGAHQAREGLFSYANTGSLFLDEIGEMPLAMQAKLLRVLEEKTIRPVGSNQESAVDVRIIAATNRDLAADVAAGRFREDLFYRLNVVFIRLPPLRERPQDIATLTHFFVDHLSAQLGLPRPVVDGWDLARLSGHDWPGNVRELRNVIERCLLLGKRPGQCVAGKDGESAESAPTQGNSDLSLEALERHHILSVLAAAAGNKSAAARTLGVSRKTLERKLKGWSEEDV